METIKIIIEKTKDLYSAYAANARGIYAGGHTRAELFARNGTAVFGTWT